LNLDGNQMIHCRIYEAEGEADAAALCLLLNERKPWRAMQTFLLRISAEDPIALSIKLISSGFGFRIQDTAKDAGYITAVSALEQIWKMDQGNLLRLVLRFTTDAWEKDPDSVMAVVLKGAAALIKRHGDKIDEAFSHKLGKQLAPQQLIGDARALSRMHRVSPSQAVALRLVQEYNIKRRSGRLPSWIDE